VAALMIMPVVLAVTRVPHAAGIMIAAGVASMLSAVVFHLLTLPVEWDASFNKALPILTAGKYIAPGEERAVRSVLKAAAFTYVAAALADLLSLWRWLLILRR
jgi:Zn-dependent membrane protease YugP